MVSQAVEGIFGDKPPEIITPDSCKKYTTFRMGEGVKISTARTELGTLRAAMRWAVREEIVSKAPRTSFRRVQMHASAG